MNRVCAIALNCTDGHKYVTCVPYQGYYDVVKSVETLLQQDFKLVNEVGVDSMYSMRDERYIREAILARVNQLNGVK